MALSEKQKRLIEHIDANVNRILSRGGGDTDILLFFSKIEKDDFKSILDSSEEAELDSYCREYGGFHWLMKILERLALAISKRKGTFN